MSGPGDEAGATALLHTQPLGGTGGDPLGAPPSGIVLPTKQKRPKRKQVKRACSNCRKSHSGCDDLRPCSRCIDNGLESSCADVPRKKRATRRKTPGDPSELGDGAPPGLPEMVCQDRACQADGRGRTGGGKMLGRSSSEIMVQHHHPHHPVGMGSGQQATTAAAAAAAAAAVGLPPAVSSHPLRLKTEPSTADHGGLLGAAPVPSKASELTAGMNKANNYQSLVTELSDLRRYNTRLEHTLQNILVEVQQLRSRSEVEAAANNGGGGGGVGVGGVQVKPEPDHHHQHHLQPSPAGVMTSASGGGGGGQLGSAAAADAAAAAANFHSFGSEVPGIATWRVHDSTLLECNDRFMEIVQQPLDTLKNNFKCLQLFPQRLYDEFIGFKQAVLYGGGNSNPSKESYFMLPDGREKPVLMTLQALKHEENMSPQFMVMHVVELLPLPGTTPPGGEAADFMSAHVHRATTGEHVIDSYASSSGLSSSSSADAPPMGSSTVTSITELDPSALHMPSTTTTAAAATTTTTTAPSSAPSSSTTSLALSSPSMLSSTSLPPSSAHQPQHQGQQQQQQQHSLSL